MTQEQVNLVTLKEFAKIQGKSESRIRAMLSKNRDIFPKPREYGKYVLGGRTPSKYLLSDLSDWFTKVQNKPKAKRQMLSDWERLF